MSQINTLINKHGRFASVNGVKFKVFVNVSKSTMVKGRTKSMPFLDTKTIFTKKPLNKNEIITIDNIDYRVFEVIDETWAGSKLIYVETIIFKDVFTNPISLKQIKLNPTGCNLPSISDTQGVILQRKAHITTRSKADALQYAMHSDTPSTHVFYILYDGVKSADAIEWGDRLFEILYIENVDERNIMYRIDCIETINNAGGIT